MDASGDSCYQAEGGMSHSVCQCRPSKTRFWTFLEVKNGISERSYASVSLQVLVSGARGVGYLGLPFVFMERILGIDG